MNGNPTDIAAADLSFIRRIIEDGRRAVVLDATPFITWGVLVIAGTVAEYSLGFAGMREQSVWIWMLLVAAGWAYAMVAWSRKRRREGALTLAGRALGALWTGCWMAMTLVGFAGFFSGHLAGRGIAGSLAVIMGTGFFVTSALVSHRGIKLLGIAWWTVGVILYVWNTEHGMAFFATMILMLQVIPGIVLQRKWRSELEARREDA